MKCFVSAFLAVDIDLCVAATLMLNIVDSKALDIPDLSFVSNIPMHVLMDGPLFPGLLLHDHKDHQTNLDLSLLNSNNLCLTIGFTHQN